MRMILAFWAVMPWFALGLAMLSGLSFRGAFVTTSGVLMLMYPLCICATALAGAQYGRQTK